MTDKVRLGEIESSDAALVVAGDAVERAGVCGALPVGEGAVGVVLDHVFEGEEGQFIGLR